MVAFHNPAHSDANSKFLTNKCPGKEGMDRLGIDPSRESSDTNLKFLRLNDKINLKEICACSVYMTSGVRSGKLTIQIICLINKLIVKCYIKLQKKSNNSIKCHEQK